MYRNTLHVDTEGRGLSELTRRIQRCVRDSGIPDGVCHVFIHHTSASLLIMENADPAVLRDIETFLARLVPDGDCDFAHTAEGPDDMPAHVRTMLTETALTIPVASSRLDLGTWQGIYLYEHRHRGRARRITVTCWGSA